MFDSIINDKSKRRILVYTVQITTIVFILSVFAYFIVSSLTKKHSYIIRNDVGYLSGGVADVNLSHGVKLWLPDRQAEITTNPSTAGDLITLKNEHLQEIAQINIRQLAPSLPYASITMQDEQKLSRHKREELLLQFIAEQTEMAWPDRTMEWRNFGSSHLKDMPVLYGLGILRTPDGNDENSTIYKCTLILGKQADYLITILFPARLRIELEPELNNIIGSMVLPGY